MTKSSAQDALLAGADSPALAAALLDLISPDNWFESGRKVQEHHSLLQAGGLAAFDRAITLASGEAVLELRRHQRFLEIALSTGIEPALERYIGLSGIAAGNARLAADRFRKNLKESDFIRGCELFESALASVDGTVPENPANAVQGLGALLIDGREQFRVGAFRTLSIRCFQIAVALRVPRLLFLRSTEMEPDAQADVLTLADAILSLLDSGAVGSETYRRELSAIYRNLKSSIMGHPKTGDDLPSAVALYQSAVRVTAAAVAPNHEINALADARTDGGRLASSALPIASFARQLCTELPPLLDAFVGRHLPLMVQGLIDGQAVAHPDDMTDDGRSADIVVKRIARVLAELGQLGSASYDPSRAVELLSNLVLDTDLVALSDNGLVETSIDSLTRFIVDHREAPVPLTFETSQLDDYWIGGAGGAQLGALEPLVDVAKALVSSRRGSDAEFIVKARDVLESDAYGRLFRSIRPHLLEATVLFGESPTLPRLFLRRAIRRFEYVVVTTAGDLGLLEMATAAMERLADISDGHLMPKALEVARMAIADLSAAGVMDEDLPTVLADFQSGAEPDQHLLRQLVEQALAVPMTPLNWRMLVGLLNNLGLAARSLNDDLEVRAHTRTAQIALSVGSDAEAATAYTNLANAYGIMADSVVGASVGAYAARLQLRLAGMIAARSAHEKIRSLANELPLDIAVTVLERGYASLTNASLRLVAELDDSSLLVQLLAYHLTVLRPAAASGLDQHLGTTTIASASGSWVTGLSALTHRLLRDFSHEMSERDLPEHMTLEGLYQAIGFVPGVPVVEDVLEGIAGGRPYLWCVAIASGVDDDEAPETYVVMHARGWRSSAIHVDDGVTAHVDDGVTAPSDASTQPPREVVSMIQAWLDRHSPASGNAGEAERPTLICTFDSRVVWPSAATWTVGLDESDVLGDSVDVVFWPGLVTISSEQDLRRESGGVWAVLDPLGDLRNARTSSSGVARAAGAREETPATPKNLMRLVKECGTAGGTFLYQGHFQSNDWADVSAGGLVVDPGSDPLRTYSVVRARDLVDAFVGTWSAPRAVCLLGCSTGSSVARSPQTRWPALLLAAGVHHVIASNQPLYDTEWLAAQAMHLAGIASRADPIVHFSTWQARESKKRLSPEDRHNLESLALYCSFHSG